ncbi:MAG: NAD-dependent epimerase/dehydratase family protein [Bacteroidales bacterium]
MAEKTTRDAIRVLLTGGSGFLGGAMIRELLDPSAPFPVECVCILDPESPEMDSDSRVYWIRGDVRDPDTVSQAVQGVDLVIHAAAIVDWGTRSEEEIMGVNVEGTRNVVDACRENGVKALVFTSSLDVLFSGNPLREVDESAPYPEKHGSSYCVSKYLAEKLVLESNGNGMKTCSLRPADIYGEGDPYHLGNLIGMARKGFYIRLGDGTSRCQHVYVGNVAHAHLLAARALLEGHGNVAGQAYFITDGPGTNFFAFFDRFVTGAGYRIWPRNLWLPRGVAYTLGVISEGLAILARPVRRYRPKLSRFAVVYTCTDYTFSSGKALRDFGFVPRYDEEEAFRRTVDHFKKRP